MERKYQYQYQYQYQLVPYPIVFVTHLGIHGLKGEQVREGVHVRVTS
jgi:hypothetical protein